MPRQIASARWTSASTGSPTEASLEFIDLQNSANLQLFGSRVEIFQFSLGYQETFQWNRGVTQFDVRGVWSPGSFNHHNSDFVFQQSRVGSSSEYFYAIAGIEHQQRLREDWSARFRLQGQTANGNLQPSEQLGAGGYDTVRGFDQRVARGDEGFWGTFELYTPELSMGRIFDWENETDSLRFLGFFDAANLSNVDLLPLEPSSFQIGSVGLGSSLELQRLVQVPRRLRLSSIHRECHRG
jgi:hemolysin activation/secretion protein